MAERDENIYKTFIYTKSKPTTTKELKPICDSNDLRAVVP